MEHVVFSVIVINLLQVLWNMILYEVKNSLLGNGTGLMVQFINIYVL